MPLSYVRCNAIGVYVLLWLVFSWGADDIRPAITPSTSELSLLVDVHLLLHATEAAERDYIF